MSLIQLKEAISQAELVAQGACQVEIPGAHPQYREPWMPYYLEKDPESNVHIRVEITGVIPYLT